MMNIKKTILAAAAAILFFSGNAALAQSSPGWTYKYVPTAAEWNEWWANKQDTLNFRPVNRAGDTMLGKLTLFSSSTAGAGVNCGVGFAPSAPADGDFWCTTSGLYVRINGATVGPLAGTGGANSWSGQQTFLSTIIMSGIPTSDPLVTDEVWSAGGFLVKSGVTYLPSYLFPALSGDVTTTAGSLDTTIGAHTVSNSKLATIPAYSFKGNPTGSTADASDFTIDSLTSKTSPTGSDLLVVSDQAASGAVKKSTIAQVIGAVTTGVSQIDAKTGAFTTGHGMTSTVGNELQPTLPMGQGRLTYSSSTQIAFNRSNGSWLWISTQNEQIPSGGITLANTGLTAGQLYYIYAYMNSGTMTLEASGTAPTLDATYGVFVKTGDATRTLVGAVYTNTGTPGTFLNDATHVWVRSWFNSLSFTLSANGTTDIPTTISEYTGATLYALMWAGETFSHSWMSSAYLSSGSTANLAARAYINGTGTNAVVSSSATSSTYGSMSGNASLTTSGTVGTASYNYFRIGLGTSAGTASYVYGLNGVLFGLK